LTQKTRDAAKHIACLEATYLYSIGGHYKLQNNKRKHNKKRVKFVKIATPYSGGSFTLLWQTAIAATRQQAENALVHAAH